MSVFRFENIEFLYGLILIPVLAAAFALLRANRKKILKEYAESRFWQTIIPNQSAFKEYFKFVLIVIGLAFLILGAANPQIGTKLEEMKREGVEIVVALDVSNSMLAEDVKPSRLDRAKQFISRLLDKLTGDKIGLVVFAGEAYLQLPMTVDYSAAKLILGAVGTEMIHTQGTAIGRAIELGVDSFPEREEQKQNRVLILITDGENHEDDAIGAAKEAAEQGVIVHAIGIGSSQGGPIPLHSGAPQRGFHKNSQGEIVVSKLNADALNQIAAAGGGEFIQSSGADPNLSGLIDELSKLEKSEYQSKMFADYEDRFQYFIAAAIFFLLAEFAISSRRNKYLSQLKLFSEQTKI